MKRISQYVGVAIAAAIVGAIALVARGASAHRIVCQAPAMDMARARHLQDAVERTAGRSPDSMSYVGLEAAVLPLTYRGRCLTLVTLGQDGELGGGVVIIDPLRPREGPWVVGEYPGAREPFAAGPGRAGFTYTTGRGSGIYDSRVVVLCALEAETWEECLSVTRDRRTSVVGGPRIFYAEQSASVDVVGDTLLLRRTVRYESEDEPTREVHLAPSRIVLPPAR
jgi:hypothetical protein